jgi:hypothetical protein
MSREGRGVAPIVHRSAIAMKAKRADIDDG